MANLNALRVVGGMALGAFLTLIVSCGPMGVKHPPGHDPLHKVVGGPPAHAPAVGLRSRMAYDYYPDLEVYFCPIRKTYFWHEGGDWKSGIALPTALVVAGAVRVSIDLETDKPYEFHAKVKGDHPGKGRGGPDKAKGGDKGKGKNK